MSRKATKVRRGTRREDRDKRTTKQSAPHSNPPWDSSNCGQTCWPMRESTVCSSTFKQHEAREMGRKFVAWEGSLPFEDRDDDTAFPQGRDGAPRKDQVVEVEDRVLPPMEVHFEQRAKQSVKSNCRIDAMRECPTKLRMGEQAILAQAIFSQGLQCFRVVGQLLCSFFCFPGLTYVSYGPQGMEHGGSAEWISSYPRTRPPAARWPSAQQSPVRRSLPTKPDVFHLVFPQDAHQARRTRQLRPEFPGCREPLPIWGTGNDTEERKVLEEGQESSGSSPSGGSNCHEREVP